MTVEHIASSLVSVDEGRYAGIVVAFKQQLEFLVIVV